MEILKATLWIYRLALRRSAELVAENWGMVCAPLAYSIILTVAGIIFIPFGFVGGIFLVLTGNACMSSGLYLIENILKTRKANLNDFIRGFTIYLWEIVRISFILWIPMMLASRVLISLPNGPLILVFIQITLYIILNAVPELIYQTGASGIDLLGSSYSFIIENWPEWFTPNLIITVAGYTLIRVLGSIASPLPPSLQIFVMALLLGLFLTYLMVFRGILFSELNGSNRRGRIYRYKLRD
jgi:hypothetical protein